MKNPIIRTAKALGIKPLTREENEALYERIRQGDTSAINEMIEGNIALVITLVANYVRQHPTFKYMQDDLQSSCYLALTKAVTRFPDSDGHIDNPMGYIYEAMRVEMINAVWNAEAIVVPAGKRGVDNPRRVNLRMEGLVEDDHTDLINLRYIIQACCVTDEERLTIDQREQGYTDIEISTAMGVERTRVCKLRMAVYRRFREITESR